MFSSVTLMQMLCVDDCEHSSRDTIEAVTVTLTTSMLSFTLISLSTQLSSATALLTEGSVAVSGGASRFLPTFLYSFEVIRRVCAHRHKLTL